MIKKPFGNTGYYVAPLGFGCMRLPMTTRTDGTACVDDALAAPLLRKAVVSGINFFDTHWFYCNFDSQRAVGAALSDVRDQVYISTKIQLNLVQKPEDFDDLLQRALELMGLDYLDFYHFPALSYRTWQEKILPMKLIDRAERAKATGLIRNLSFSFHSDTDKMPELINTGAFSTMLTQYNIVDRKNESLLTYAKSKGLGTMVMGPLMGGIFADGGQNFLSRMDSKCATAVEMAMRFVWAHPDVDIVLSGISNMEQLMENICYAENIATITTDERNGLIARSEEIRELNDLYCTNCNYCHTCPEQIRIGRIFTLYLQHKIWGLTDSVRRRRDAHPVPFNLTPDPTSCTNCGICKTACPQNIDIPAELNRIWPTLTNL